MFFPGTPVRIGRKRSLGSAKTAASSTRLQRRCWRLGLILGLLLFTSFPLHVLLAQGVENANTIPASLSEKSQQYQSAMAAAVRRAAQRRLGSVVSIEVIGGVGSGEGEVERDAPGVGIIVDPDGYIIASNLVATGTSASLIVVLPNGDRRAASLVATDTHREVVLLKIDTTEKLEAINFSEAPEVVVGQTVIALGRYGETHSPLVSRGILSAEQRLDGIALQCDARVSPSFYGGPLIDLYGRVLGVLVPAVAEGGAESATSWYDSGIAFAIPGKVIARKLERMKRGEDIKRGVIGIVSRSSDPYADGTTIAAVRPRSPAEQAGLRAGDEIVQVGDLQVQRQLQIRQALGPYDAGETISITYRREDELKEVDVTLADSIPPLEPQRMGLLLSDIDEPSKKKTKETDSGEIAESDDAASDNQQETSDKEQLTEENVTTVRGVNVDAVLSGTSVQDLLFPGDQIVAMDGVKVAGTGDLRRRLISLDPNTNLNFKIVREGETQELTASTKTIEGEALTTYPSVWEKEESSDWEVVDWKLPEAGNVAAVAAPKNGTPDQRLGLFVVLLNPGEGAPKDVLENWKDMASAYGVVVCAIAPENQQRWLPKEVDVVTRFASSLVKAKSIHPEAVGVGTTGALQEGDGDAADAMAMVVALSQRRVFHGVAVSVKTSPPRIRLPENEGDGSFQLLLALPQEQKLPDWVVPLRRAGYPVVRGDQLDAGKLLRWVRLLQTH